MKSVKQFIANRNEKIKTRFTELKKTMKRDDVLEKVAGEFELSKDSINTIVYRK
jgi:hypothetical protein